MFREFLLQSERKKVAFEVQRKELLEDECYLVALQSLLPEFVLAFLRILIGKQLLFLVLFELLLVLRFEDSLEMHAVKFSLFV